MVPSPSSISCGLMSLRCGKLMSTVGGGGAMYVNVEFVDRVGFVDFEFPTTI